MPAADARALPMPIIAGPTAGGKSALAYALVRLLRAGSSASPPIEAEIISADAYQIYKGLDIATAKPTPEEQTFAKHHLIGVIDLARAGDEKTYTVADWLAQAEAAIAEIRARGRLPIVVGGTHLYIKSLLEGLFEGPDPDPALRASLQARPLAELRADLERIDLAAANRIHANDARRTIRALEVFHQTGTPISMLQRQWDAGRTRHDSILIGLDWPVEALNRRINARVKEMMQRGLLDETRELWQRGAFGSPGAAASPLQRQAAEALGTKQLLEHLQGRYTLDDAIEKIKIETRRFAKNQRTWLKRLKTTPGSLWLEPTLDGVHFTTSDLLAASCARAMIPSTS
jgi:tRNA dimethylallyltransferase